MREWGDVLKVVAAAGVAMIGFAWWQRRAVAREAVPTTAQTAALARTWLAGTGSPDRVGSSDYWRYVTPQNYDVYAADLAASENRLAEQNEWGKQSGGWYVG